MNYLKNMSVARKLRLIAGVVLILMIALGTVALRQMSEMTKQTDQILKFRVSGVRDAGQMQYVATRLRTRQYRMAVTPPEQMDAAIASYRKAIDEFDKASKSYGEFIYDKKEQALYDDAVNSWKDFIQKYEIIPEASKRGDLEEASQYVKGAIKDFDQVLAKITLLIDYNEKGAKTDAVVVAETYDHAKAVIISGVTFAALMSLVLTVVIGRLISTPLQKAVELSEKVSKGDLTSVITHDSKDETGKLLAALKRMNDSLVGIVSQVRNSSDSIATGSAQIATGNADLSQRTEQQASSLQETAASMEQMSATARSNADSARHAVTISRNASQTALLGGQVVSSVVDTMTQINESSKQISSIISVIDEIAFQTNILALNAAVEAARAAEHGRGFAVVASEVRQLAQRSAGAAKEIKTLIHQSVERVETGTKQVDQARITMDDIVSQVTEVTRLLDAIGTASNEQNDGIMQVNQAVSQLDQVTQQNAALVEESAAAAESLKHQAASLAETVSTFKLR